MNTRKIVEVLRAEEALVESNLIANVTRCGHPGRCAIGALLFDAGMTNAELRLCSSALDENDYDEIDDEEMYNKTEAVHNKAFDLLFNSYGATTWEVHEIMSINDSAANGDFAEECGITFGMVDWKRDRKRVCAVIKEIEAMEA